VTEGLDTGSRPDVGRAATEEVIDEIRDHLTGPDIVFVTAGVGGGTGTGSSPVVTQVARVSGFCKRKGQRKGHGLLLPIAGMLNRRRCVGMKHDVRRPDPAGREILPYQPCPSTLERHPGRCLAVSLCEASGWRACAPSAHRVSRIDPDPHDRRGSRLVLGRIDEYSQRGSNRIDWLAVPPQIEARVLLRILPSRLFKRGVGRGMIATTNITRMLMLPRLERTPP
jgi:hypothetical protein